MHAPISVDINVDAPQTSDSVLISERHLTLRSLRFRNNRILNADHARAGVAVVSDMHWPPLAGVALLRHHLGRLES